MNALRLEITQKYGLPFDYEEIMKSDPELQAKAFAEYYQRAAELSQSLNLVNIETVVDHIEHVIEVTECYDHIGLGSDYDGIEATPIGLEHVGKLSAITKELLDRGHEEKDIKKILGDNFIRILKEVCGD
jgi:membrane dipeptidase